MSGWILWWAVGCTGEVPIKDTTPPADPPPVVTIEAWGAAGWDPVRGVDEDGVLYEPESDSPLTPLEASPGVYAWQPDFAPGVHTVTAGDVTHVYEVGDHGQWDGFDIESVVGVVWEVDGGVEIPVPAGLGSVAWSYIDPVIQLESADGQFRILTQDFTTGRLCEVLRATATVDTTGLFTWSTDTIDVDLGDDTLHLEDLAIRFGWGSDGDAAGLELAGTVDTLLFDAYADDRLCDLALNFGYACFDCTGSGDDTCMDLRLHAGVLIPSEEVIPDDVDLCGVDLEQAGEALSCEMPDIDCSWLSLPFVALVLRRRR